MAMNMVRGEGYNTAKAREEALAEAESKLVREGHKDTVSLYPKQIKIMPELFSHGCLATTGGPPTGTT